MTIKQQGGIFGRNPTFNDVTVDGTLITDGSLTSNVVNAVGTDGTAAINIKEGASVRGTIGHTSDDLFIANASCGFYFDNSNNRVLPYNFTTNSLPIGSIALGQATYRFKELYLSENVYVGSGYGIDFSATSGTGTSELFDDYEEGTYDASVYEVGGSTLITATGSYIKVGKVVTVSVQIGGGTTGGAGELRSDLPFPASKYSSNTLAYKAGPALVAFTPATTYVNFVDALGSISPASKMIGSDVGSGTRLYFNLTYITS